MKKLLASVGLVVIVALAYTVIDNLFGVRFEDISPVAVVIYKVVYLVCGATTWKLINYVLSD